MNGRSKSVVVAFAMAMAVGLVAEAGRSRRNTTKRHTSRKGLSQPGSGTRSSGLSQPGSGTRSSGGTRGYGHKPTARKLHDSPGNDKFTRGRRRYDSPGNDEFRRKLWDSPGDDTFKSRRLRYDSPGDDTFRSRRRRYDSPGNDLFEAGRAGKKIEDDPGGDIVAPRRTRLPGSRLPAKRRRANGLYDSPGDDY